MQNLTLSTKVEQIQCAFHRHPIIQLNIGQNIELGNRLICKKCNTLNQKIVFINVVEERLEKWLKDESSKFSEMKKPFYGMLSLIDKQQALAEKQMETLIDKMRRKCKELFDKQKQLIKVQVKLFEDVIKKHSQTKLLSLCSRTSQQNALSSAILQELALFFSEQDIIDGKIELKETLDLSPIETQIKEITQPLVYKHIKNLLEINTNLNSLYGMQNSSLNIQFDEIQKSAQKYFDSYIPQIFKLKQVKNVYSHYQNIKTVTISSDESMIASADCKGQIIVWCLSNNKQIQQFQAECCVSDMMFSDDNKILAIAQAEYPFLILLFNISKNEKAIKCQGHTNTIQRIYFSPDCKQIVSGGADQHLKIWQISDQSIVLENVLSSWIQALCVSQNQKYISTCCANAKAYLFDYQSQQQLKQLVEWQAHSDCVFDTIFTPDSQYILTSNKEIKLWSINQLLSDKSIKTPIKIFKGDNTLRRIQLMFSGQILVGNDGKIKIWSMSNTKPLCQLELVGGYQELHDINMVASTKSQCIFTGVKNSILQSYELQVK